MHLEIGTALAIILALGLGSEWVAWRLQLPSVLVLLVAGFLAGPVFGILQPDLVSDETLVSIVSLAVAVILFEGSLSLRLSELGGSAPTVWRLLSIGVLVTWLLAAAASVVLFGLSIQVAVLLGAVLVVTGPTVIIPLLIHIRPAGQVGAALRWEGIINDPIGAVLAVLVYEGVAAGSLHAAGIVVAAALAKTIAVGVALGAIGAAVMIVSMRRYWLPDRLHSPVALAAAIAAFAVSDVLQPDSGLVAVTVMGVILANQASVRIVHIVEFKENLRVLLISVLFVVLASRVDGALLLSLLPRGLAFAAILILVARPLAVLASTVKSRVTLQEKAFLSWLAPRGIVAASISSMFALRLEALGYADAGLITPITFITIVVTVLVYGVTAAPVARRLGLAVRSPQGVLVIGADTWIRGVAKALQDQGVRVVLVDSNWSHLSAARLSGLKAVYSSVVSRYALDELDLGGIGRLIAMSPVDEFNTLAVRHFSTIFGRANVYQVAPDTEGRNRSGVSPRLTGRILFGYRWTFPALSRAFEQGASVKVTCLTEEFGFEDFRRYYGDAAQVLFLLEPGGKLHVVAEDSRLSPRPGHCLISLVVAEQGSTETAGR
ncbi:MAG: sodium:proton antiporter [Dehalococcoidia bacterium]|nr:sodium:proton antiporter [Dehalococcoidia bacterium]